MVRLRTLVGLATFMVTAACAQAPKPVQVAEPAPVHVPPAASASLLSRVNFGAAAALDEDYRGQFEKCDGLAGQPEKDTFRGHSLWRANTPSDKQYYLCSRDPSRVKALLKLSDGAVYWESKMALDVDGSAAAWEGIQGATDQKDTWFRWPSVADKSSQAAQVDPDRFPFIVIPVAGLKFLTGDAEAAMGAEFRTRTKIKGGDMGVVIYGDRWTPVFVADGGPFMRLGEGSTRVFEGVGQSRCKGWNTDKSRCVGDVPGKYPYRNFGIQKDVVFIIYPGSAKADIAPGNAIAAICAFAKEKLGLTGSSNCP